MIYDIPINYSKNMVNSKAKVPHIRIPIKIENTNECTCILTSVFGISFHQTVSYVLITE